MKRFFFRLTLFLTVFPALLVAVFWDYQHHLFINTLIVLSSIIGAWEMAALLEVRGFPVNHFFTPLFGALFPILAYLEVRGTLQADHTIILMSLMVIVVFSRHVFAYRIPTLEAIVQKVTGNLAVLIYPSFLTYFLVKLTGFPNSHFYLLAFFLITFGNDAMAYAVGNLWKKGGKGLLKVSPNKSLAGFIGGFLVSPVLLVAASFFLPETFGSWVLAAVFGSLTGLAAIFGDLFESGLKRSVGRKDSGTIIPGRGGMLDSIDSLLFAAPIFYIYLEIISGGYFS